jgi:hypothetical protein
MKRKHMPSLREVAHAGVAENLAVPLHGSMASLPEESSEICFLAVGATAEAMARHLEHQRNSAPWERSWICDPANPYDIKIIAFAYRSVAKSAMSTYAEFGVPAVVVTKEDLPFLVADFLHIVLAEDCEPILLSVGLRLGLVEKWLRQHCYDETMRLLKDPKSAKDACWLLNHRDRLYGYNAVVGIDLVPWSVRVTEWDVLPCKAIHRDGSAIYFDGDWKCQPLPVFWRERCDFVMSPYTDLPRIWRIELMKANRVKAIDFFDDDEDSAFSIDSDRNADLPANP